MPKTTLHSLATHPEHHVNRRKFARMLGVGAAALILGPTASRAASWFSSASASPDNPFNLPEEWVHVLGAPLKGYSSFLAGLQLRHLTLQQIIEPHMHMRDQIRSGIPPATMWRSMKPTLLIADQIAAHLGENVGEVVSAYRSPAYNAHCPGASPHSQHMNNVALDLVFRSSPAKVTRVAKALRSAGKFSGGVGQYPGFTHVDTRGYNADWNC
ncbi:MAG TPA: D-Ala-D-Ala carboxypeptidase family metallohydrolase [Chthoniobacterales bacterium]|nr:D-Ala-D-Ala carboxypeptidase family metallohydrolase [Chthoniobacterales bacterium]